MITSMAFFAVEDSLIKFVTSTIPIGQILIMFGLGGGFNISSYGSFQE